MMKKTILILSVLTSLSATHAKADEGMWTLSNLPQAVYERMQQEGYHLPYGKLYNDNDAIVKAVVNFGDFCSGVVVSPDGLVFTNHHCGFEAIRSHSTVEHDYMLNGFVSKSYEEELPNENLFVSFMVEQRDYTDEVLRHGIRALSYPKQTALLDSLENVEQQRVEYASYSPSPRAWANSAARQTTGCGHARHVTSLSSASTATRRLADRPNTPRTMSHTTLPYGHV